MAFLPVAIAYATAAAEIGGAATAIYSATRRGPPPPRSPGAPPVPQTGGSDAATSTRRRSYRPAAQLFPDQDLRLGMAGRLGL